MTTTAEFIDALARLETLDWDRIAIQATGDAKYADWCRGISRRELAAIEGFCQPCTASRTPVPAAAWWISGANGNWSLLCASCLSHWQANAADDPDLVGWFVLASDVTA